jgi:hypothetical protein
VTTAVAATNVEAVVSVPADATQDNAQDNSIGVRPGSKTLTFTANINDSSNALIETANVPVVAVVTAETYFPTGETVSLTGTTDRIVKKDQSIFATSLTNADGEVTFTVTSTTALAGQVIDVALYVLGSGGTFINAKAHGVSGVDYVFTYAAAAASALTPDSTVVSSESATVSFAVTDGYGEPITSNANGAFSVELKAPNLKNLELYAAVDADGVATFTFDNYLTAGGSDVLTANVYTGTSTNQTLVGLSATVSLYAVTAVASLNVATKIAAVVVDYADYIEGKTSVANPGPTGGTTYTGTVVDSNGAGIPGSEIAR